MNKVLLNVLFGFMSLLSFISLYPKLKSNSDSLIPFLNILNPIILLTAGFVLSYKYIIIKKKEVGK